MSPPNEILLVEDDPILGRGLAINLEHEGYKVIWSRTLKDSRVVLSTREFQLVILDLGLPDGSGLDLLRELRKSAVRVPIVILTAKADVESVVEGLQNGANDYVRKPFDDRELLARIKAILRDPAPISERVQYGELVLKKSRREILYAEDMLDLTPREFDILAFFIEHAEVVVTRDALLGAIDKNGDLVDRTIDSNVSHVRSKLRKSGANSIQISSIYGVGYRLEKA